MSTVRYTVVDNEIVAEKRGGIRRTYVPDPLGSTVALLDSNQQKTDTFTYWPYGEERSRTGTSILDFRFGGILGYYKDNDFRCYVRARELHAKLARWFQPDPLFLTRTEYLYTECNPVSDIDPSGLRPVSPGSIQFCKWKRKPLGHGKYCGSGRVGPGNPCDCIDVACQTHDACLGPAKVLPKSRRKRCDKQLCQSGKNCLKTKCATPPPSGGCTKGGCQAFAVAVVAWFCYGRGSDPLGGNTTSA